MLRQFFLYSALFDLLQTIFNSFNFSFSQPEHRCLLKQAYEVSKLAILCMLLFISNTLVEWHLLVACHGNSICLFAVFIQVELSRELLWITKISSFARGVKEATVFVKGVTFSSWLWCLATNSLVLWSNAALLNKISILGWSYSLGLTQWLELVSLIKTGWGVSTYWVMKSAWGSEAAAVKWCTVYTWTHIEHKRACYRSLPVENIFLSFFLSLPFAMVYLALTFKATVCSVWILPKCLGDAVFGRK